VFIAALIWLPVNAIAIRGGFPLATADEQLKRAAGAEGVLVL
jgi:hypothetical protein